MIVYLPWMEGNRRFLLLQRWICAARTNHDTKGFSFNTDSQANKREAHIEKKSIRRGAPGKPNGSHNPAAINAMPVNTGA